MKKPILTQSSLKWYNQTIKVLKRSFLSGIIIIVMICIFTVHASSLPMVVYPLKPSPDTGPYQDAEFLEIADEIIYSLSNQTIPNGTALLDLQTTQQKLARMSISPNLYPIAKQINAYLYYTAKAGSKYDEVMSFYSKPYSPVYKDESQIIDAQQYQAAAQDIWNQIKDRYPGVTPYRLETSSKPFSTNEDPNFKWPPYTTFSSPQTGGLW